MIPNARTNISKFLILLFIFGGGFQFATAANDKCAIQQEPAIEIKTYIDNAENISNKLASLSQRTKCSSDSSFPQVQKAQGDIISALNKTLNLSYNQSSSMFYFDQALRGEVPPALFRDKNMLDSFGKKLQKNVENIYANCAEKIIITEEFSKNDSYKTIGKTIGDVALTLVKNHTLVIKAFENAANGKTAAKDISDPVVITIPDFASFSSNLIDSYGASGKSECVQKQEDFKVIQERLKNIGSAGGGWKKGMNEWKSALALLRGAATVADEKKIEQDLAKYRKSQGMSDRSTIALKIGADGSENSKYEGATGFFRRIGDDTANTWKQMNAGTKIAWDKIVNGKTTNKNQGTTEQITRAQAVIMQEEELKKMLSTDYISARSALDSDFVVDNQVIDSLISQHATLAGTKKLMENGIKKSEALCNAQGKGLGNCEY